MARMIHLWAVHHEPACQPPKINQHHAVEPDPKCGRRFCWNLVRSPPAIGL